MDARFLSTMTNLHQKVTILGVILLILCGDIEANPGPTTRKGNAPNIEENEAVLVDNMNVKDMIKELYLEMREIRSCVQAIPTINDNVTKLTTTVNNLTTQVTGLQEETEDVKKS
ncbi:hypothetical protein SNE40_021183 [Patella caerulea]|uniref:Uncharacterized protein n=1 Tax=Patella caerulea TaxID=87958 RepID=A0AAN8FYY4_PATCE